MDFREDAGFTIVELMMVVFIIGILVATAVATMGNVGGVAERNACLANQRSLSIAIEEYGVNHDAKAPASAQDLAPYLKRPNKDAQCPTSSEPLLHFDESSSQLLIWCAEHVAN